MKNMKCILLTVVAAMLLVVMSVAGTLAYLTSETDQVNNTFTVGKVDITLDEADVDLYGKVTTNPRDTANEYKLIAGHTYTKDPTVHVQKGSEPCYVRIFVSINEIEALKAACDVTEFWPHAFVGGWEDDVWQWKNVVVDGDTQIHEFWYFESVDARNITTDYLDLPALFTSFTLPGSATNEEIEALEGLEIKIIAQAVQSDTLTMDEAFADAVIDDPTFAAIPVGGDDESETEGGENA